MGHMTIAVTAGAAVLGGALGAALLAFAGAPGGAAAIGGLIAAGGAAAAVHLWRQGPDGELKAELDRARADLIDLAERQARAEANMAEVERRTVESPALVWRAATADIEMLGSLVSNLAKAVAEHERLLSAQPSPIGLRAPLPLIDAPPAFGPAAEPPAAGARGQADAAIAHDGVAGSATPPRRAPTPAAPAVIAELKTTLAAALASDRLELCLQPIAALPQRRVKGYEATLRLKGEPGDVQDEADLRRIAAATGLEPELDRALVERAVQVVRILRARNRESSTVCAVAGASLTSETFQAAVQSLVRGDPALMAAVTLEIADADFQALDGAGREAMRGLAALGVGFGLARPAELKSDMAEATMLGVRQLRLPASMLLAAASDGTVRTDIHPADLAEFLRRRNVELLICDVETEQEVLDLLELGAPLVVGPLFGAARPVRPEIIEPTAVPSVEPPSPLRNPELEPPAPVARQSFRSVLRRA